MYLCVFSFAGKLAKSQLVAGRLCLNELDAVLEELQPLLESSERTATRRAKQHRCGGSGGGGDAVLEPRWKRKEARQARESLKRLKAQRLALSNAFYTAVPHAYFTAAPPELTTLDQLAAKRRLLERLGDLTAASAALGRASASLRTHYEALEVHLAPLDPEDDDYKLIHEYATCPANGAARCRIQALLKVERPDEHCSKEIFESIDNHQVWRECARQVCGAVSQTDVFIPADALARDATAECSVHPGPGTLRTEWTRGQPPHGELLLGVHR